ncbi:argininosuccinate lyase [Lactarius sanguifluus]|nr:argininosuccinate lyase [Lactarius sanguifluus]
MYQKNKSRVQYRLRKYNQFFSIEIGAQLQQVSASPITMADEPTKQKLWGGRFTGKTDPLMHAFNQSLDYDRRMYAADIRGSIAYAKSLTLVGILTNDEEAKIVEGLTAVKNEWESGQVGFLSLHTKSDTLSEQFEFNPDDEDIHTANERRLRTIKSRQDMRIWLLDRVDEIEASLVALIRVMRAQPIRWSHLLLSHAFSFSSDLERLRQLIPRISVLPLGSGALAGNPFSVDRLYLAKELGFQSLAENSLWGVGDRDFVIEFMMWASLTTTHLSRMSEDLIIYSTAEFGFITLSDAYRSALAMAGFLVSYKGLPSTYNKDLQEDKEPLFDSVDTVSSCLRIAEGVIGTLNVHPEKMRQALTMDVLATDLADYLVRKGVPFRETHHISGRAVALAESQKCQLNELTVADYKNLHAEFGDDVHEVFDFEASVERRQAIGGPSRVMISRQVAVLRERLSS